MEIVNIKMQNAKRKFKNKSEEISERMLDFGTKTVGLVTKLKRTAVERHIANQLLRSATSVGANYEEARAAESRADFTHKLQLVLKELKETVYWLRLVEKSRLSSGQVLEYLLLEANELSKIIAKSIVTARRK